MLEKIKDFVGNHLDFRFYSVTWIALVVALAVVPCILYLPEKYGYENGLLENLQMVTLFTGFILAVRSKVHKKFFYFAAMVIGILAIREVNCGRTLFFAIPGTVNEFYTWKQIKYGWLAHPIYGLYMTWVGIYFLRNKLFIDLWKMFSKVKLPVWNILLMLTGMTLGMYAEKVLENFVFEEITELLFYVSLVGIIYLFAYNKNFKLED